MLFQTSHLLGCCDAPKSIKSDMYLTSTSFPLESVMMSNSNFRLMVPRDFTSLTIV